jgi:hypothetical protein
MIRTGMIPYWYLIATQEEYEEAGTKREEEKWSEAMAIHPIWTLMREVGVGMMIRVNGNELVETFDENMLFVVDEKEEVAYWATDDDDDDDDDEEESLLWSDVEEI